MNRLFLTGYPNPAPIGRKRFIHPSNLGDRAFLRILYRLTEPLCLLSAGC
jgi:hypothetical protein